MQLPIENPYASPCALESLTVVAARKPSLWRGVYFALLWGLVVMPVPFAWLGMSVVLRPDLPPIQLPELTFNWLTRAIVGLSILPAFFGLVAIANYTSARQYRFIVTFFYFGLFWFGVISAFTITTECWGRPFYPDRRYPPLTQEQSAWNFACVATPMLLFSTGLTCWRIVSDRFHKVPEENHAN